MQKIDVKKLKKEFLHYANGKDFPDSLFEWHSYSGDTKQVFVWVDGEWNNDIRVKLEAFLQKTHKRLTISRMITCSTYKEQE